MPMQPLAPILTAAEWATAGATIAIAVLALAGVLAYLIQRQQQRLQFGPILRVDIGPDEQVGDWSPPKHDRERDRAWEFQQESGASEDWREIFVWLENQQTADAGIASDLRLFVELDLGPDADIEPVTIGPIRVVYLAPGVTMRVRILRLRLGRDVEAFTVRLISAGYRGRPMHRHRDAHGRLYCRFANEQYEMRSRILGEDLRLLWQQPAHLRRLLLRRFEGRRDDTD